LSATLDPYQITSEGVRINEFNANIFRLTNASLSANYSLSSKDLDKKNTDNKNDTNNNNPPDVYGAKINPNQQARGGQEQSKNGKGKEEDNEKTAKLFEANIPWSISFVYSASYSDTGVSDAGIQNHTVGFSGNLELTPKWKVGYSSGYDLLEGAFSFTRLNFSRDLDSWNFNFNWVPFGGNTFFKKLYI